MADLQKDYAKAAKDFEMATKTLRLIEAKVLDLNKKMTSGLAEPAQKKIMATLEKLVKDQFKAGKKQDKAHAAMEKALTALRKSMS